MNINYACVVLMEASFLLCPATKSTHGEAGCVLREEKFSQYGDGWWLCVSTYVLVCLRFMSNGCDIIIRVKI